MTRFCPICGTQNEATALSCKCGRLFEEFGKTSRSDDGRTIVKDVSPPLSNPDHAPIETVNTSQAVRGRTLTDGLAVLQSQGWGESAVGYRRRRVVKRAGALLGALTVVLFSAAYFGGVFPAQGKADTEEESSEPVAQAQPAPLLSQAVVPAAPISVFPESNVPYKATRAITGSVIAVADSSGQERRVTLLGIRVPKLDENFGVESKENLWALIANKPLMINRRKFTKEVDTIAEVTIDGTNVGLEHLRSGLALLSPEDVAVLPAAEQQQYLAAAQSAKSAKYGMWSGKPPASVLSSQSADQMARSDAPFSPETRRSAQRRQSADMTFDSSPGYVYEPEVQVTQPAASEPVAVKQQPPPSEVPAKQPVPTEPAKVVAATSATGRKYVRGPFGGCYYINSSGNKSYVDRSKCESP